jgi:hypothetical protein
MSNVYLLHGGMKDFIWKILCIASINISTFLMKQFIHRIICGCTWNTSKHSNYKNLNDIFLCTMHRHWFLWFFIKSTTRQDLKIDKIFKSTANDLQVVTSPCYEGVIRL